MKGFFLLVLAAWSFSPAVDSKERGCLRYLQRTLSAFFSARSLAAQYPIEDQQFIRQGSVYLPIVGDTHGELERFLSLISQLQVHYQVKFPVILQLGDLGINQDFQRFPRWSRKNKHQINDYFHGDQSIVQRFFPHDVVGKVLVVRGNHDFFLERYLEAESVVEFAERFFLIPDGVVAEIELVKGERISIGAMGGAYREEEYPTTPLPAFADSSPHRPLDILITHQGPTCEFKGHLWVDDLLAQQQPRWHFHGHSHMISNQRTQLGQTQTWAVANLPPDGKLCPTSPCVTMLRYDLVSKKLHRVRIQTSGI